MSSRAPSPCVVLARQPARDNDVDILRVYRSFNPFQLLHHPIYPKQRYSWMLTELHLHREKPISEPSPLLEVTSATMLRQLAPDLTG